MAVVETTYEHIILDENSVPIIEGANTKVIELVLDQIAYGWSPEEMAFQHPHLTIGQIYSALAYYSDHKEELDKDIERRLQFVNGARANAMPSPLVDRLRAKGLL